jgi:hypothetical protein
LGADPKLPIRYNAGFLYILTTLFPHIEQNGGLQPPIRGCRPPFCSMWGNRVVRIYKNPALYRMGSLGREPHVA